MVGEPLQRILDATDAAFRSSLSASMYGTSVALERIDAGKLTQEEALDLAEKLHALMPILTAIIEKGHARITGG